MLTLLNKRNDSAFNNYPEVSYETKTDIELMIASMQFNQLNVVREDMVRDARLGLDKVLNNLDWLFSNSKGFGSFILSCNIEGVNVNETRNEIVKDFVLSKHFSKIKEKLSSENYKAFQEDLAKKIRGFSE